jgi:hypothetical protein
MAEYTRKTVSIIFKAEFLKKQQNQKMVPEIGQLVTFLTTTGHEK